MDQVILRLKITLKPTGCYDIVYVKGAFDFKHNRSFLNVLVYFSENCIQLGDRCPKSGADTYI